MAKRVIVDNIFDTDADGIADSWISNPTGNNVRGVAFSPLDVNLWHPLSTKVIVFQRQRLLTLFCRWHIRRWPEYALWS